MHLNLLNKIQSPFNKHLYFPSPVYLRYFPVFRVQADETCMSPYMAKL